MCMQALCKHYMQIRHILTLYRAEIVLLKIFHVSKQQSRLLALLMSRVQTQTPTH